MNKDAVAEMSQQYQVETAQKLVPEGYKQTEVGVIPEDWEVVKLGDIARFIKGSGLPKKDLVDGGENLCIHYGQLFTTYGPKIESVFSTTNVDGSIKSEHNDILMPTSDVTPNGLATASCILESDVILGGDILVIRPNIKLLNGVYFAYLVTIMREHILQLVTGSTVYHLYGSDMEKFFFPKPPIKEQSTIANALSEVDTLLSELEKLIAKKQAIKTATMQQLLTGRTRLPQFAHHPDGSKKAYKQSELGEIPEDWEIKLLSELANIRSGGTPSTTVAEYWDGSVEWCTPTDITALNGRKYLTSTSRKISELGVAKSAVEILPPGTIVMTSRATIGECAIAKVPMTTNQGFKNFLCGSEAYNEFMYYLLGSLKDRFIGLCSGSTFLEISSTQVRKFNVAVPAIKEQTAIATILADMDAEIQALEHRLNKTRQIKQGMMQELLTGKTRLVNGGVND